jgi:uncharacterized protein YeaO (DUF488 family)
MPASTQRVMVKRVYDSPARTDGTRALVDRLWPRGVSKERASVDAWLREVAPSDSLRHWFHAHPDEWSSFRKRYLKELSGPEAAEALEKLYRLRQGKKPLTLLFASKNEEYNNAIVLRDLLNGMRKPPTGTGPAGAKAARHRQSRQVPRK